jgi:hypothetical protein
MPCEGTGSGDRTAGALDIMRLATLDDKPPSGDYQDMPVPEDQETMPDAESADWEPAGDPPTIDVDAIETPEKP